MWARKIRIPTCLLMFPRNSWRSQTTEHKHRQVLTRISLAYQAFSSHQRKQTAWIYHIRKPTLYLVLKSPIEFFFNQFSRVTFLLHKEWTLWVMFTDKAKYMNKMLWKCVFPLIPCLSFFCFTSIVSISSNSHSSHSPSLNLRYWILLNIL